ncbi:hypothetical protein [Adlercreutzia sp. ZJ141]|uniref:hypothetical protein n=1 Tax=Adlercreutzia sp. ZJ141 TaxID=2709406 RepID=UPI0013ECA6FF|nr:hypothetical protein [Adlercreutzia sp. ZJ141]
MSARNRAYLRGQAAPHARQNDAAYDRGAVGKSTPVGTLTRAKVLPYVRRHHADDSDKRDYIMYRRALRALAIVVAIIALVPASAAVADPEAQLTSVGLVSHVGSLLHQVDLLEQTSLPDGFEDEVMSFERYYERRCDLDAQVVGFSLDANIDESLNEIRQQLTAKGWDEVRSGVDGCSTFTKSSGRYQWAFVQCVPIEGWTSVVVRYELGEGESEQEGG